MNNQTNEICLLCKRPILASAGDTAETTTVSDSCRCSTNEAETSASTPADPSQPEQQPECTVRSETAEPDTAPPADAQPTAGPNPESKDTSESKADSEPDEQADESHLLASGYLISNRYEVLAHIGSGGMGEVYKVLDRETQNLYALKMISPHLAEQKILAKRLEHEAQAARTLVHGNIVSVYDVGKSSEGVPYLLMDYVEGESLDQFLQKEVVLKPDRALAIFIQIAEALVHAQQKSIVHRDLKPSNILMTKTEGGADMVKIVDFGIAKISDQDRADKTKLTQTGELLGTPLYMSPEQCTGDELDARSDIYSFGCIMYEVLCGRPAFGAENPVKVILKHLNENPPPFPKGAGIASDLQSVIKRCLEKNCHDRYATAVELQIDLERVHDGRKIARYKRKRRLEKKQLTGMARIAAATLFVFMGLGFWASTVQHTAQPSQEELPQIPTRPETFGGRTLAQWSSEIENSPDDPVLYLNRGMLHANRDERTNAIDDFTQAIALKPDYLDAYHERATMYVMIAQLEKAAKDADKLISLNPDSAESYATRAWVYGAREQYAEALADWQRAAALDDRSYYYYRIANIELKLAQYDKALSAITRCIRTSNRPSSSFHGIDGMISTFRQDLKRAATQLKLAVAAPDARGVEWQELAYYYLCAGNRPEAEKAVRHAKAIETFPARAYRLAGEYYRAAGEYDKALKEFSASTSLEEYPPGYRQKALTYLALGQWRSAYSDLEKSFQLNPYSPTTLSYLALVESHLGKADRASEHMRAALKEKSPEPIVYVNRALITFNGADAGKAVADAERALAMDPWLKEGYAARSLIRKKLGDVSGADKDAARAKELYSHLDL